MWQVVAVPRHHRVALQRANIPEQASVGNSQQDAVQETDFAECSDVFAGEIRFAS